MTRKTAKKSKGAKPLQPQMQWALICEAAKHGTYTYLQQCMAAYRLAQRANDYIDPLHAFPLGAENLCLLQAPPSGVPPEIAQKLADKQSRGLEKANAGYREAKDAYVTSLNAEAQALYEEFRVCSREERARFCPSKLKQMNLLLLVDTLLDRCASVSIPLEWTPEWLCVRDADLARDPELRDLVRRAFEALEINAFVQLMRVCAANLFPPLREAWLPIYEEQSIRIFNKWRCSLLDKRTGRPKKTVEHFPQRVTLGANPAAPPAQGPALLPHRVAAGAAPPAFVGDDLYTQQQPAR